MCLDWCSYSYKKKPYSHRDAGFWYLGTILDCNRLYTSKVDLKLTGIFCRYNLSPSAEQGETSTVVDIYHPDSIRNGRRKKFMFLFCDLFCDLCAVA